jgi:hypothetical protein
MYQSRDSYECKETKPRAGKRVTLVKFQVGVRLFLLSKTSGPTLEPTQLLSQSVAGILYPGTKREAWPFTSS